MLYPTICDGCPGRDVSVGYCPPDDPTGKKLVVYGETPGEEEVDVCGFVGRSGRLLRACEQRAGWNVPMPEMVEGKAVSCAQGEVAHLNVVCCRPRGNKWPGDGLAGECWKRHGQVHLLARDLPRIVCGANATRVITGWDEEITETRGTVLPDRDGGWVVSTLHPAYLVRGDEDGKSQDQLRPVLIFDLMRAGVPPRFPKWIEIVGSERVAEALGRDNPEMVAIDMEGEGYIGIGWDDTVYGVWWDEGTTGLVERIFRDRLVVFHNAGYDLEQIGSHGIAPPDVWLDTIVMAGVLDPCVPLNLQAQVLTHVPGTVAWKGLVDFKSGERITARQEKYIRLWENVLGEYKYVFPSLRDTRGRLAVYNALDVWGTWWLAKALRERLGDQMGYYRMFHQPIQKLLYDLGNTGLPVDPERMAVHRKEILKKELAAKEVLVRVAQEMLENAAGRVREEVMKLESERAEEYVQAGKKVKFTRAEELTKLRTKLKTREAAVRGGFNVDSSVQRKGLLKGWFGIKLPTHRKTRKETTDEQALERMLERLRGGTLKPKRGTVEDLEAALSALVEGKKWATWRRNYLTVKGGGDEV
jgi:uracil-DNA glycosylase family 4